ncbi:unnamed protein product [Amoebophrya sp. A120]|nr:unnamed protein product [Amoebophrya sp. A120]|eukprot:GSA120T00003122001.1
MTEIAGQQDNTTQSAAFSPDFVSHYPKLLLAFVSLQAVKWVFAILEVLDAIGPAGYAVRTSTLTFDVALCQMMYLGTLHYGLLDFSKLNVVCRLAFLVNGGCWLLHFLTVDRPRSEEEALAEKVTDESSLLATVDACIWAAVFGVSAWVGIQALIVGRTKLCEKWTARTANGKQGTAETSALSEANKIAPESDEHEQQGGGLQATGSASEAEESLTALSDKCLRVYSVALLIMAAITAFCVWNAATAETEHEAQARIQNEAVFSFSYVLGMAWGMKVLLFDASKAGTRPSDLMMSGSSAAPRSVYIASALLVVLVAIPVVYVVLAFSAGMHNDGDVTGAQEIVEWGTRLKFHLAPALVIFFIAAWNFGMKPSHLWNTEGMETRFRHK